MTDQLALVKTLVLEIRKEMPLLGTRPSYHLLRIEFKRQGITIGRNALVT